MRLASGLLVLPLISAVGSAQTTQEWENTRSIAESQHEIVMLLIEKREFKQAVEEARKIFYLPFPAAKHEMLVTEATQVADALIHHKEHALAREVLDEALLAVTAPKHRAKLLKEKCYLLKKMGNDDEAMSCFRKAVELDNSGPPR